MALPPLAYLMGFIGIAQTGIDYAQTTWDIYQSYLRMGENERFWNDYKKNTGVTPLYPYRAGAVTDNVGQNLESALRILRKFR